MVGMMYFFLYFEKAEFVWENKYWQICWTFAEFGKYFAICTLYLGTFVMTIDNGNTLIYKY